jgi:hypothetical protein
MPGGGSTIGRDLPPGHLTFAGLSRATGVPVDTLRRWYRIGALQAAYQKTYGEIRVNVFTLDAIVQVKKLRGDEKTESLEVESDS